MISISENFGDLSKWGYLSSYLGLDVEVLESIAGLESERLEF